MGEREQVGGSEQVNATDATDGGRVGCLAAFLGAVLPVEEEEEPMEDDDETLRDRCRLLSMVERRNGGPWENRVKHEQWIGVDRPINGNKTPPFGGIGPTFTISVQPSHQQDKPSSPSPPLVLSLLLRRRPNLLSSVARRFSSVMTAQLPPNAPPPAAVLMASHVLGIHAEHKAGFPNSPPPPLFIGVQGPQGSGKVGQRYASRLAQTTRRPD